MIRKLLVSLLLVVSLAVVILFRPGSGPTGPVELSHSFDALGSYAGLTIVSNSESEASAIVDSLESLIDRLESEASVFGDGPVARLNRQGALELPTGDSGSILLDLLLLSSEAVPYTEGCFDPAIGNLVEVWGFPYHPDLPDSSGISGALRSCGWEHVSLGDDSIFLLDGCSLDFGAVAKGAIVDSAYSRALELGALAALVEIGGEIRCGSSDSFDRTWRIAIRHPRGDGYLEILELPNGAVATSGDYESFFELAGARYCHILDPKTGWPEQGVASATVVCRDAATADLLATAICVGGEDLAISLPDSLFDLIVIMLVDSGAAEGSSGLREVRYGGEL
jgi:thiamine biosynthesis lipoprotein